MRFKDFMNYLGQVRLYSLVDLILLLIAVKAERFEFIGAILLHLGFLAYLEFNHGHVYRKRIDSFIWICFGLLGIFFYRHVDVVGYILFSYLYTKKKEKGFAALAPVFRGLQSVFLIGGIIGYIGLLIPLFFLMAIRNFVGDIRDIEKDKKEGMRTLPIVFGMNPSWYYWHLIVTMMTSTIIWFYADISFLWLLLVYIIQVISYDWTPR